ncbi:Dabb family protein [Pelagibius litoralis]|uniref:Dabb family protein n=1 Tax=Pelagibius litoralis TaxID=374515 RepID=A0A967F0K7_9PROT|nr:Dabb family protein [Pelagibius litoralis]NIA70808.1 Dabb family protein [Pelagibius litoralis]
MIRHIVLFRARRPDDVEAIRSGLDRLREIPDAAHLEVALNGRQDAWSSEIDVVVYGEFRDAAALEAYKAHPLYHEAIRLVRPLRDLRIAADYQAPTD